MGHDCRSEFIDRGPVTVALRVAVHYPDASKVRDRDRSVRPAVAKIRVARIFARMDLGSPGVDCLPRMHGPIRESPHVTQNTLRQDLGRPSGA